MNPHASINCWMALPFRNLWADRAAVRSVWREIKLMLENLCENFSKNVTFGPSFLSKKTKRPGTMDAPDSIKSPIVAVVLSSNASDGSRNADESALALKNSPSAFTRCSHSL